VERRLFFVSPLLAALAVPQALAGPIDPHQTFVLQPNQIRFQPGTGLPPGSGETAPLYGERGSRSQHP
jgi:hypothetical protein